MHVRKTLSKAEVMEAMRFWLESQGQLPAPPLEARMAFEDVSVPRSAPDSAVFCIEWEEQLLEPER